MDIGRYGFLLGELLYRVDRRHRTIVRRNLQLAFPLWSQHEVAEVSRRSFRHFGKNVAEMLQLASMAPADILGRCRMTGAEHLYQALQARRGLVLASAHLGNWEFGLLYLSCRFQTPILLVVRPFWPDPLDRWINGVRRRFGNKVVGKSRALYAMMKTIRQGGIVALMLDVSRRKQSVPAEFFGHPVRASHAAALLAVRCNVPVIAAFSSRNSDDTLSFDVLPPLAVQRSGDFQDLLKHNTQLFTETVETAVRKHPDQYFWMQKRWKDYYPHIYPSYRPRPKPSNA